jgi:hypothetical protein
LQVLDIHQNHIGNKGLKTFALQNLPHMMAYLNVAENDIDNEGALALANSERLIGYLDVSYNHIGSAGIQALQNNENIMSIIANYNDGPDTKTKSNLASKIKMLKTYCSDKMSAACMKLIQNCH